MSQGLQRRSGPPARGGTRKERGNRGSGQLRMRSSRSGRAQLQAKARTPPILLTKSMPCREERDAQLCGACTRANDAIPAAPRHHQHPLPSTIT